MRMKHKTNKRVYEVSEWVVEESNWVNFRQGEVAYIGRVINPKTDKPWRQFHRFSKDEMEAV
jgi:hypothetical protein